VYVSTACSKRRDHKLRCTVQIDQSIDDRLSADYNNIKAYLIQCWMTRQGVLQILQEDPFLQHVLLLQVLQSAVLLLQSLQLLLLQHQRCELA
jgi:hypothetical protein